MSEHKRLLKNTGIIAIGNLSTKIVSFFLIPLYTTVLTMSEYGTVDYIISISVFCVPIVSLLMDESMFRFLIDCKSDEEKSKVISLSLIFILLGSIVFIVIASPILWIIEYQYSIYLILYVISSVLSIMVSALLRGIGRTDKFAIYNFLMTILQLLLTVLFIAIFRWGIKGMLMASIIVHFVFPFIYAFKMKIWQYISFENIDKTLGMEMIRYSIPLIPNKLSWTIINLSDRILIMNFIGSDASGLYAISYKFPNLMDTFYGFFYQSWKESSARALHDKNPSEFYNQIYKHLKNLMYSIVLVMITFMPIIFHFMINDSYSEAIMYVPILLLATYFANISGFYGGIFTAYKETKVMGLTTIAAALINLFINLLLLWKVGLYAAAISTLISNLTVYLYRRVRVKKYIKLEEDMKMTFFSWVSTIIVFFLFYSKNTSLQIFGGFCAIIYTILSNFELLVLLKNKYNQKKVERKPKNDRII